jgi:threonine-phosphate decarboxylase
VNPDALRRVDRVPHGGADDPDVLDLSANVNPEVPEGTREVYEAAFEAARRYPDDSYPDFRAAAADYVGCTPDRVVPTPGGLASIRLAVAAAVGTGDRALVPAPSFGEYAREVRLAGGVPEFVAPGAVLDADPAEYALVVVCHPNNPTGRAYDPDELAAFARRCGETETAVLVDEAFLGFTDRPSAAGLDAENVVVARSLTKLFGLPGVRAGFAVASGDYLDAVATGQRAWSLSTAAATVGAHCMRDRAFITESRDRVRRERDRLRAGLSDLGLSVWPSAAPFVLVDLDTRGADVDDLLTGARERGVVIRDARTFRGLDTHVRVAVRDRAATDRALGVFEAVLDG